MKIVFIGCVQFSCKILEHLLAMGNLDVEVVGIVTREKSSFNSDFTSLVPLAEKNNIPYFIAEGNDQSAMLNWIENISLDVIYCFGWSFLLEEAILKLPKLGVIGYHPASLPQNRGRHPIIWALALGLQKMDSTFFFMNETADAGDILNQKPLSLLESDDAGTVYHKIMDVACEQISEFTLQLIKGDFPRVPQDNIKANSWRKRNKKDGCIDWRMTANSIKNLVRALTRPYPGAHFDYSNKEFKVWKTELVVAPCDMSNIEPGKIVNVKGKEITVKCGQGLIKLIDHDCNIPLKEGSYL